MTIPHGEDSVTISQVRHSYASTIQDDTLGQIINIHTANNRLSGMPNNSYKAMSPPTIPASRVNHDASRPLTNASLFTTESLGHAKLSLKSNLMLTGHGGGLISSRKQGSINLQSNGS
mmetsp:Transcript_14701/g.19929  ORF Transcript_14701/g.19929 Transcript_14701/m.19929 type:complete len:118 (-) Transcript_14701:285-638(-)